MWLKKNQEKNTHKMFSQVNVSIFWLNWMNVFYNILRMNRAIAYYLKYQKLNFKF